MSDLKIRNQELIKVFNDNPFIIAGVGADRALAVGKLGDDTHRLADALAALGDPTELIATIESARRGRDIGEYVAGGNACFIVVNNSSATVCFETANEDAEYIFSLEGLAAAARDWQLAWNSAKN